ncbi:MAG: Gfo/Idh/MocA family oxidoreductase [Armatimonadota bacterium]|nr:MAG: Gfo/Idh/MocA family oxidoreductase [Armatimonadota bacterium]
MVKIGILSFAHMHAGSYARCLNSLPNAQLVGIADDDKQRGKEMARQFETTCMDRDKLLKQVDAVIVTAENARHADWVLPAAKAGTHVLCEKPIAADVADGKRIIDACTKARVKLGIAFPCRYIPGVLRLKALCDNGDLGEFLAARGTNRGRMPGGWFTVPALSGGGAVLDHTVHVVDLMRWILKAEIVEVYAEVDRLMHDIESDDCGTLTMTFDNGVFATLDPSWSRPKTYPTWGDVTLQIVGTKGAAAVDGFGQKLDVYDDQRGGVAWNYWGSDADLGLVADFVDAVQQDRPFGITGTDGLRALEVAMAAYRSAEEKRPVGIEEVR